MQEVVGVTEDQEKKDDPQRISRSARELPAIGGYFSAAYLVFLASMAFLTRHQLLEMSPNEFGDMMAGAFAPLAFLWLVLGFFQQGEELKASVRALEIQGEELRASVDQQRELVSVTREQLESERQAVAQERAAAEHAAQPVFIPRAGGSYSGAKANLNIGFTNAGADATDVQIVEEDRALVGKPILPKGDSITYSETFSSHDAIQDNSGYVIYYDAMGNRRARSYSFIRTVDKHGRPGLTGQVDETLYKPPFPWEKEGLE